MRSIRMYVSDLKELLANREYVSVRRAMRHIGPVDLADGWELFDLGERKMLFQIAPRQKALQLFEELDPLYQEELLKALKHEDVEELVEDLDPAETGRVLRDMPPPLVRQLEAVLRKGRKSEKVERYMKYPDESVGSHMRSNYVTLDPRWNCRQALERISMGTRLRHIETTYLDNLYVVDADERLLGTVTLKELVVAPANMPVQDIMETEPKTMRPEADQEEAANLFDHYKLSDAPVVDARRKLLGILLDQDIDEVAEEETREDFARMAGTHEDEFEAKTAWDSVRHRVPWLAITCFGQLIVASIIRGFEHTLSEVLALVTFMPFIAAMGGNVGTQSAIMVVRDLSTGEAERRGSRRTVVRDFWVGILLGLAGCIVIVCVSQLLYGARFGWSFSFVAGLGIITSMTLAATLGAGVPLVFRRFGIDPAYATGPLVSTLTDIISTGSYLALATYLLLR